MKRLALLLVALLLLAPAVSAGEVWEKQLGEEITAVATDEYGDRIFVGTESGMLYCYDASGSVVWSVQLAVGGADPSILDIRADTEGHILVRRGNDYYLRNAETGASVWYHANPAVATADGSISNTGTVLDTWDSVLDLRIPTGTTIYLNLTPHQYGAISGDATWMAVTKPADTNLYLYSVNVPPDDWIAPPTYTTYGWENRISHTIAGTTQALTNYPVEITVIRGAGSSSSSTLYAPECRADFADIRFTAADGVTQLPYYLESVVGSTATFFVNVPSIPASPGTTTIYVYWTNFGVSATTSDPDAWWIPLYDDFEDGVINPSLWAVTTSGEGTVTETGGYLDVNAPPTTPGSTATITGKKTYATPTYINMTISFPDTYLSSNLNRIQFFTLPETFTTEHAAAGTLDLMVNPGTVLASNIARDPPQPFEVWFTPNNPLTIKYGSDWAGTVPNSFSTLTLQGNAGQPVNNVRGHFRIHEIAVLPYTPNPPTPAGWGSVESVATLLDTETLTGTIVDIDAPETGDWVAVSTTTKTYIIQITDTGFGTTYSTDRTGTPYQIQVADGGSFAIEGRNILADIFRIDTVQVGTYTAGGAVQHVAIAQKNGLYAAAGSDDGKYYVFSKDAASSWYLLYSSDSYDPVTALAMSWRGELLIVGRADGRLVAFQPGVEEDEYPGTIRLTVYKDALPYAGAQIALEHGGTDQTWDAPTIIQTDDYGTASIPVRWGEYVRVTVGDGELQRVILPAPSQTDYILRIKGPDPLRTGAQYSSGYDPDTQRIYLHYDDTREKTHLVVYTITRSTDNAVVFQKEYTSLPVNDYYQIPAGWTNSSYRVQLTASGSPSFTNTWSQWVGADGVASLPADLDSYARMGIAFFLILFVAGLFSYLSGPQGAVVVSMFAGALVLWGWLPLSPTVIALCIVWAFLGLLGRTSGE